MVRCIRLLATSVQGAVSDDTPIKEHALVRRTEKMGEGDRVG